jgi:hypothetical protein
VNFNGVDIECRDLFKNMRGICRSQIGRRKKIGRVIRDLKDKKQEKWYSKNHKIVRDFYNEDYEKANREVKKAINSIKNESLRSLDMEMDFYLIGIDPSIKEGNPGRDLVAKGKGITSNDPVIRLRSLMIDIQDFETSRLNEINTKEIIEGIEYKGAESEERFMRNSELIGIF